MQLVEVINQLLSLKQPLLTTQDVAVFLKISRPHASKILERLQTSGSVLQIRRGLWSLSKTLDPLLLPEYLVAPSLSYISLQTALYYHGMISQIPSTIYAVSLARARKYNTPFGVISIHHIPPKFFFGYKAIGKSGIKLATPEKALLDVLYLAANSSSLFKKLPELEIPPEFEFKKAFAMINKIRSLRIRNLVSSNLEEIKMRQR